MIFFFLITHHLPYDPAIPFLGIHQREIKTYVYTKTYTWRFTAALFMIAENWKQPKYPATGKQINKLWYMHILLLNRKGDKLLIYTTWKNIKSLTLSETIKTQKSTYCMIVFTESSIKDKINL